MRTINTLLFVLAIQFCFAQILPLPTLPSGWERVYIKNVGSFDLPPTMEIQKGKYKEYVDEVKSINGFDVIQLTAQQSGLNKFDRDGFKKYARVMIETDFGSQDDFEKLDFNISEYTGEDINELNSMFEHHFKQSVLGTGLKIIEWNKLKIEKVNGMSCIHISYKRQLLDKPLVLVNMYMFHNNDRMHTFTLSYRLSEEDYWKSDFITILNSFRITNIR